MMRLQHFFWLHAATTVIALPTVLITTPKPWCVAVDGAQDEALLVTYEAPGTFWIRMTLKARWQRG